MFLNPALESAVKAASPDEELEAVFTLAATPPQWPMPAAQLCQAVDDFIWAAQDSTGIHAKRVEIFPKTQTVIVTARPLLIQTLMDQGRGIVSVAGPA